MDLPRRVEIVPWGFWKAINFTPVRLQGSSYLGGGAIGADDNADQKYIEWEVLLDSGTWAIDIIYLKQANGAITDIKIDGSLVGSIDHYNASTSGNNVTTISGISIGTPGYKILRLITNSKNASSTSYRHYVHFITLRRTGA